MVGGVSKKRERKTWAQVAQLIVNQIRGHPGGENLIFLRFDRDAESKASPGFSTGTATASVNGSRVFARFAVELMRYYSREYDVTSFTLR
ncbi:hypothetical protein M446_1906 [Methylobacterium sp. 4-46]|uniref:hypothetical protein n=1 Tax=unclassified Methylobacterium TaxID=2615210 RepID=UPI000165CA0F|nr:MULTISPECIES: hypothetical protein [Methylobacterium]ACA16379.1 hypothetical protein M446_1906 [Methylobacterium sp. 4-46]WFT82092.1 hypothetical protein QA634_09680 [Methylobacterium nodulans]